MKTHEILNESRNVGEWIYHASYVPNKDSANGIATWLKSILSKGLRPSSDGYMGPGTYFAYEPDEGYYHVNPEDSLILRVKWKDLLNLYGVYPKNKNGVQRTEEEIIVPGSVPGNILEVEYFPGEWWSLNDALAAEVKNK